MINLALVNATDLGLWADRRTAQERMPELIRRLVLETVDRVVQISFRAQEGVQLGGWDGITAVEDGNAFVPTGLAGWEVGTKHDVRGKANDDYSSRRDDPRELDPAEASFVFITPRRWGAKKEWIAEKTAEGVWREVRAYDSDDLETWLSLAPVTHIWLSALLGRRIEEVTDIQTFWTEWSSATRPPFSTDLVIGGRQEIAERIRQWLTEPPGVLALQADAQQEAVAFLAASLDGLPATLRDVQFARSLVVSDAAAWRQLVATEHTLLLVPIFEGADAGLAVRNGHHVLIPLGRENAPTDNCVVLPRPHRDAVKGALTAIGLSDGRAGDLATVARRSLLSFRRRLALGPELQQPKWARPGEARSILPAMLAGTWNDVQEGDREIIAALAGHAYEEAGRTLTRWAHESDPPVRRVGNTWFIISKDDAWSLLARMLSPDDLQRFGRVAIEVLGEPDPALDLPPDRRWAANVFGRARLYSGLLRQGLADTLALMGARSETTQLADGSGSQDHVDRIVRRLLDRANEDREGHLWMSLADVLPLLSEAAPGVFLEAVDIGLSGEQPVLINLFTDVDQYNILFSASPHTELLWALENLAWSSDYLSRAALLLARLARLDPGGRLMNRPINSLREIFLPWYPQTAAPLAQRVRIIDTLRQREPEVAWHLLVLLLPQHHGVSSTTHTPCWREWKPDENARITYAELYQVAQEIMERLLVDVGVDGNRWRDLLEHLTALPRDLQEAVIERLRNLDAMALDEASSAVLRNALREVIGRHRRFPDAPWAMSRAQVDQLAEVYAQLEPDDPVVRTKWLFADAPGLLEFEGENWEERDRALAQARRAGVGEVYARGGLQLILSMAADVQRSDELGRAFGQSGLLAMEETEFLRLELANVDRARAVFARGYVDGRFQAAGWDWAEARLDDDARAWSALQRADFLSVLPSTTRTWAWAERFGAETEREFWSRFPPFGVSEPAAYTQAAGKLIEYGQAHLAVMLLSLYADHAGVEPPPDLIFEALAQAAQMPPPANLDWSRFAHHVAELLERLEASGVIAESRLAELEWGYLPLLRYGERPARILHRALAQDPLFFVEVVSWAYKAHDEESHELTENERMRAELGNELLESWRQMPGRQEDGSIDAEVLSTWITRARKALAERGRGAIGDQLIGKVLRYGPGEVDSGWPDAIIRDAIERVGSEHLERGFEIEVYNGRGIVSRDPLAGGDQERQLADRFLAYAQAVADGWPRTAAMLRRIADSYIAQARREDQEAELREDLWR